MERRKLLAELLAVISAPAVCAFTGSQGKGHGKDKKKWKDEHYDEDGSSRSFRQGDYGLIVHYYNGPRNLPPGLQKKYERTGILPPGWQKKMRPFPPELVRQMPPPPPDCEFGYIDGVAVVYNRKTRIILDSIDLISAIAGH